MPSKTYKNNEKIIIIALLLILCLIGPFVYNKIASSLDDSYEIIDTLKVEDFVIEKSDNYYNDYYVIKIDEEFTPSITFYPDNLSYYQKSITYQNSNSNSVSIDYKGRFKGLKEGTSTVKLISNDNNDVTKTIKVMVIRSNNELKFSNNLTSSKQIYSIGAIIPIDYYAYGLVSLGEIKLTSSNPDVAYFVDNYLYATSIGTTIITLESMVDSSVNKTLEIKVVGSYDSEETTSVSFLDRVTSGDINYTLKQFLSSSVHEGYTVTLNASGNGKGTGQVEFSFNDDSLIKVISYTDTSITFSCLEEGNLEVFASSKFNKNIVEKLSFSILPINPRSFFTLVSPSTSEFKEIDDDKYLCLNVGEIKKIRVFSRDYEINKYLNYTFSNDNIVKVEDGYLKALNKGECIVTITYEHNPDCILNFKVKVDGNSELYQKIENITLLNNLDIVDYEDNIIKVNSTKTLEFDLFPNFSLNMGSIIVKSSDESKLKVTTKKVENKLNIKLEFINIGNASLYIIIPDNEIINQEYSFKIINEKDVDFTYTLTSLIEKGQVAKVNATTSLLGVEFTYSSSNEDVISISDDGLFLGKSYGKTTINIHASDGITYKDASFEVECVKEHSLYDALNTFKANVKMNDNEINLNEKLLYVGDTFTVDVSFTPSNHPFGKYHEVKIEKPEILSVDKSSNKYTFTCLKSGTTKVTIYPYANSELVIEYTVTIANVMPEFMYVSLVNKKLYVGDKYQFGYLVDWRATYSNVDIIIGDDSIIGLEDDYLVIRKAGKTYVSFIIDDNDDNTVSYVQTLNIETFNHSVSVKLERYGYGNFIVRVISQILCLLLCGIITIIIINHKPLKFSKLLNYLIIISIILIVIILMNIIRMNVSLFRYEKYDMLINIISYLIGVIISLIITLIKKKEVTKNA